MNRVDCGFDMYRTSMQPRVSSPRDFDPIQEIGSRDYKAIDERSYETDKRRCIYEVLTKLSECVDTI